MYSFQRILRFPRFPFLVGEDGAPRPSTFLDRAQLGLRPPHWCQEARPHRGLCTILLPVSFVADHLPIYEQYSFINIRGNHELIVDHSNESGSQ